MKLKVHRGYRYRIDDRRLTETQLRHIRNQIGSRRYLWNKYVEWLAANPDATEADVPSYTLFTKDMPWASVIDSTVFDNVKRDFKTALKNHLSNPGHFGKPRKKRKRESKKSFKTTCNNHSICLRGSKLKIPKLKEEIRVIKHRCLPPGHRITSAVVTEEPSGELFVTIQFELEIELHERSYISYDEMIGLDYSSPDFYVDDAGQSPASPHAFRRAEKKIADAMETRDRKEKGSKNKERARQQVARAYRDSANARGDFTDKESAAIAKRHSLVFVEGINLAGMAGGLHLGKATNDNGFGMFRRQLSYKLGENGGALVKVPRFFPSSKLCSHCGHKHKELSLGDREWTCPVCGHTHERDTNAAVNLREFGLFALMCEGYVLGVVDGDGEYFDMSECYGVGSASPDFAGMLSLARGRFPEPAGGTPVVTYVLDATKACLEDKEQRIEPVCLSMDYAGAFITAKRSSVAAATEAPASAALCAASRG